MNPLIVIGALALVPAALIILFRINAALVFLSLCAGNVLVEFLGDDVLQFFNSFFPTSNEAIHAGVRITLLVLPALLTILFMKHTVSGGRHLLNILPGVLTGVVVALLVVPLLTDGTKYTLMSSEAWTTTQEFQSFVVGSAALSSFLFLWSTNKGHRARNKHK